MVKTPLAWKPRRIPEKYKKYPLFPQEKAKQEAENEARWQRCRPIFERVRDELMATHYNWYIVIDPNSGDYFIEEDELVAIQKLLENLPKEEVIIRRLNETGTCGSI
ncbi:hypothetical protein [Aerosakkonema funiforme]|uniref:Uncharacterized protein n=1 Tax=Aerosakkonema funiforme FACHB-1375 TaxID=2949571 RepID=A0A926VKG2_9CYAN|nr:hypothetical protein [Aerosakkonema funiforme]MBD2185353.1 hypothetical protein [Aerosakkonema funiforme FACHB-1375]